jgi:hypothetical protein
LIELRPGQRMRVALQRNDFGIVNRGNNAYASLRPLSLSPNRRED